MKTVNDIFRKRRQTFHHQCLRYLRYVLNDHFVLFIMIGLGFIMIQYSQLLRNLPDTLWPLHLILILASLVLAFWGNFNAYLEKPDQHFLLTKEAEAVQHIQSVKIRSFLLWGALQTLVLTLLLPLALSLGWPLWLFAVYLLASLGLKWLIFGRRAQRFLADRRLNWQAAIRHDSRQKQAVLKFFSLFTQVKGISQPVKRRAYLDSCLTPFRQRTWTYLFARAFVRSGNYLALSLRLAALSLAVLFFVRQDFVAVALVLLLNYLLLFQLLALYVSFDYQYLTQLFPLSALEKKQGLKRFLRFLMTGLLLLQVLAGLFLFQDKIYLLAFVLIQLGFNQFYLAYKIKKLID